jgi:hypothetical protein
MRIFFLLAVVSFNFLFAEDKIADPAGDDCTMDITNYTEKKLKERKLVFDKNSKDIKKHLGSKLIIYGFEERAVLSNDTEVQYTEGGCAHYGYTFSFKGKNILPLKDSEKIDRAIRLLTDLPPVAAAQASDLLRALEATRKLKEQKWSEGVIYLSCGDPVCELVDKGDGVVQIGYSF